MGTATVGEPGVTIITTRRIPVVCPGPAVTFFRQFSLKNVTVPDHSVSLSNGPEIVTWNLTAMEKCAFYSRKSHVFTPCPFNPTLMLLFLLLQPIRPNLLSQSVIAKIRGYDACCDVDTHAQRSRKSSIFDRGHLVPWKQAANEIRAPASQFSQPLN